MPLELAATRWIDQGATQALPIMRVATRQQSGFVEDLLRSQVADKTNWRALLKGDAVPLDLPAIRDQLLESCAEAVDGDVCVDLRGRHRGVPQQLLHGPDVDAALYQPHPCSWPSLAHARRAMGGRTP